MLVNKLREIAEAKGCTFNYGDYDWQNLNDFIDPNNNGDDEIAPKYFLLLWKDRSKAFNDFNVLISETFTGEFILAERSDFGEKDYNYKYENHISKMESELDEFTVQISDCDDLVIESWNETEVSNVLDTNVDGIKVSFKIKHTI